MVFAVTFFSRNNLRGVSEISPEVLRQPVQTETYNSQAIEFTKDGYAYNLTPLYDYEISGLVVGKMDYRIFSLSKLDSVFPFDLCLTWGSNVSGGLYRDRRVRFSQDCRWCWAYWEGGVTVDLNELSNSHLLVNRDDILKLLKSIVRGDQIRIKGKLVNVIARPTGKTGQPDVTWKSSVSRTDGGAGACEVVFVEEMEILKAANVVSRILFKISSYGLLLLIAWGVIGFFRGVKV